MSGRRLGAMTFLEFLARAAPAGVVAPDLVVLPGAPRLDLHRLHDVLVAVRRRLRDLAWDRAGRRRGERARLRLTAPAARVLEVARTARAALLRRVGGIPVGALDLDLDVEDVARELLPDRLDQGREHLEALVLVGDERVLLGEAAEVDALAEVVHVVEVLAPALVDDLEQDEALDLAHEVGAQLLLALVVGLYRVLLKLRLERLALDRVEVDVL